MKTAIDKKKIIRILLWVFIAAGFVFTRLFKLDTLPGGLHFDEAGAAYDAWSLANFGVDRYRTPWPIYLTNYGDGQSIMLAYLAALLIKLSGGAYSIWCIRLPMTIFSALNVIFGVKLAREIFGKETFYPELTGIALVFAPYFIMQCRFGFDCNLMLGASTVFLYYFTKGMKTLANRYYVLAGITGGLMLYTYALSQIILPLFLILSAIYMITIRRFIIKKWLISAVCILPFAAPLIYFHIINRFRLPQAKFLFFTIIRLRIYRGRELSRPKLEFLKNIFMNMFIGDKLEYDSIKGYPPLTYSAIALCAIGFVTAVVFIIKQTKKKQTSPFFPIIAWLIVSVGFFTCLYSEVYRANFVYTALAMLMVTAVFGIVSVSRGFVKGIPGNLLAAILFAVFLFQAFSFTKFYFTDYSRRAYHPIMFSNPTGDACKYVQNDPYLSSRTTYSSEMLIYYLLGSNTSPYDFVCDGNWTGEHFGIIHNKIHPNEEPEEGCNYVISKGMYVDFQKKLRTLGFTAKEFSGSVLYYK